MGLEYSCTVNLNKFRMLKTYFVTDYIRTFKFCESNFKVTLYLNLMGSVYLMYIVNLISIFNFLTFFKTYLHLLKKRSQ